MSQKNQPQSAKVRNDGRARDLAASFNFSTQKLTPQTSLLSEIPSTCFDVELLNDTICQQNICTSVRKMV